MIFIVLVSLVLSLAFHGTVAVPAVVEKTQQIITMGKIRLAVVQSREREEETQQSRSLLPGAEILHSVWIESRCNHPFYLRARLVCEMDGMEIPFEEVFQCRTEESQWQFLDGWYYYQGIVNPSECTEVLFSSLKIREDAVDESYIGKAVTYFVVAQGVQSQNNPIPSGAYDAAFGALEVGRSV